MVSILRYGYRVYVSKWSFQSLNSLAPSDAVAISLNSRGAFGSNGSPLKSSLYEVSSRIAEIPASDSGWAS